MNGSAPAALPAALNYLASGCSVIPIVPGTKRPAVAWSEFQGRRPTRAEVRGWWAERPPAGVAIICGRVSSVAVLDGDPRNGGHESLAGRPLPPTPTVSTGGGGWHYYFAVGSTPIPKGKLLPGVDLQAEGSYVVAPPSLHPNGTRYAWAPGRAWGEVPLAALPFWVRALVRERAQAQAARPSAEPYAGPSEGGDWSIETVLSRLAGVRKWRRGWLAICPAHLDHDPSLSVALGDDGRLLFYCFAGCTYGAVRDALERVPA